MNPFVLCFADGTMFFVGLLLAALGAISGVGARRRRSISLSVSAVLLGAGMASLSATPIPAWVSICWLLLFGLSLLRSASLDRGRRVVLVRRASAILLALLSVTLCALEWPRHVAPRIAVPADHPIYVLGDSLTAGVGEGERIWPEVLAKSTGLRVVSLARAGATAATALRQADGIEDINGAVLIEIGGNDLLGSTDDATFQRNLGALLEALRGRGIKTIAMFELPLPPFRSEYGRIQRELAASHDVVLLPKRLITTVLGTSNATLDGLHLSQVGHDAMAAQVQSLVQ